MITIFSLSTKILALAIARQNPLLLNMNIEGNTTWHLVFITEVKLKLQNTDIEIHENIFEFWPLIIYQIETETENWLCYENVPWPDHPVRPQPSYPAP